MKTYSIILLIAALAVVGGCSSAYRSGQTPDAVYYSPARESAAPASSDQVAVTQGDNPDAGQYVTYDDGDNSGYANDDDGYYTQRINMFDRPGSLYAFNNYYGMGGLGLGYYGSPYLGYYSSPYMSIGNPFMWSYPFLSLGLNFGSPWGGLYSPIYGYGYSPYSAGYLNGYMNGYYGGGYGYGYGYGGYYGKHVNLTPRPAVSYGPRRSVSSRAATAVSGNTGTSGVNVNTPRRVFRTTGNTNTTGITTSHPRRVFKSSPGEHPVNVSTPTRVAEKQPKIRIFRRSTATERSSNNNNRVETYRPRQETRVVQPRTNNTRSVPSFNSSAESHSAPARTFSPRGRR